MSSSSSLKGGFDTFNSIVSTEIGASINDRFAISNLSAIDKGIQELSNDFKKYIGNNNPQLKGYVVEDLVRGSFNTDAISKRTGEYCWTPPAIDFASVDVQTNWGDSYQLKFYNTGEHSAFAQSVSYKLEYSVYLGKLRSRGEPEITLQEYLAQRGIDPNIDPDLPIYEAQARLIPADQMQDAIQSLKEEMAFSEAKGDIARAERFRDTLIKLTDRVKSPKGAESLALTEAESRELAECARNGTFDPARYDITLAKKADQLYLCESIAASGLSSSIVSATLKAAPDIAQAIVALIEEGTITIEDVEKIGEQFSQGAKEGFIRGVTIAAVKNACALGYFGKKLQKAALDASNPAFNNVAVVMVSVLLDTTADAIKLAKGELSTEEYSYRLEKRIYVSGCSVVMGTTFQGFMPFAPVLGYVIGSFVGSILGGITYEIKEHLLISLCVKKGYTFFGIVNQDYTLPESVLRRIGIKVYETKEYNTKQYSTSQYQISRYNTKKYKTKPLSFEILRRGVIGVRKIGYI